MIQIELYIVTFFIVQFLFLIALYAKIYRRSKEIRFTLDNIGSKSDIRYMNAVIGKDVKIRELEKLSRGLYGEIDNKREEIKTLENKIRELNRGIRKDNKSIYAPWIHKSYNYVRFGHDKIYLFKDMPSALAGHVFNFVPDDSLVTPLINIRNYYKVDKGVTYKIIRE